MGEGGGGDTVGVSCMAGRRAVSSGLRFLAPFLVALQTVQPIWLINLQPRRRPGLLSAGS